MNPTVGSTVVLQGTFRDADGVLFDPDTVDLNIIDPLGILTTVTPTNVSTGIFEYQLLLDTAGMWHFQFVGTTDESVAVSPDENVCAQDSVFAGASA